MSIRPPRGPLLKPGDDMPGGPRDGADGMPFWVGELDWRTQHGVAVVQWRVGRICYVWDALTPNGARQSVEACSDMVEGATMPGAVLETFRFPVEDGFIHGRIEVRSDEVAFSIVDNPTLTVEPGDQPLFDAMRSDEALMRDLRDKVMAFALHEAIMRSKDWTLSYAGTPTHFVPRYASHVVAALRANGECYQEYYGVACDDLKEEHIELMRAHLTRIGIL